MNKKTLAKIAASAVAVTPFFAFAATIETILKTIDTALRSIIPMLMVLATIVFLWGIISYITAAGDEKKAGTAKNYIQMGLIGLFCMIAVWGIIRVIIDTFGLEIRKPDFIPSLPSITI